VEEERFSAVGWHNVLRASNLKISHKKLHQQACCMIIFPPLTITLFIFDVVSVIAVVIS